MYKRQHYIAPGASVKNSILADGCVIEGEVENWGIHSGVKDVYKRQEQASEDAGRSEGERSPL